MKSSFFYVSLKWKEQIKKTGTESQFYMTIYHSTYFKLLFPLQAGKVNSLIVVQDPAKKARINDVHLLSYRYYVTIDQQLNFLFFDGPLTRSIPPVNLFNILLTLK